MINGSVFCDGVFYERLCKTGGVSRLGASQENRLSNCLMLKENLSQGQSNRSFRIYGYLPNYRKKKILLFEGRTVGHKVYCRFGALRCSTFEVEITDFDGPYELTDIKAFYIQ